MEVLIRDPIEAVRQRVRNVFSGVSFEAEKNAEDIPKVEDVESEIGSDDTYATSDIEFDDDDEEDDPFENLRKNVRSIYALAIMLDLRAEQTYMRSIAKAGGSLPTIAWITIKDQIITQFLQGCGMQILKITTKSWVLRTSQSGRAAGVYVQELFAKTIRRVVEAFAYLPARWTKVFA
ncbi:hypothetical protein V1512DRAFT_264531 [Lipomyces arxii]|uniref:uncharacterized protein n=1 Tax=Lipomyces arxii TaxID=56418 RepID=UPI0034CDFBE0